MTPGCSPAGPRPKHEPSAQPGNLLDLQDLVITVPRADGSRAVVVDHLSLSVATGERVALVGESGSGKSFTALAALGLVPEPGEVSSGRIRIAGKRDADLTTLSARDWRAVRGRQIGLVLQEPGSALNPVYSIGFQLIETIRSHRSLTRREASREASQLLADLDLSDPNQLLRAYPHQLSGGQQQRIMLALSLAGRPQLIIADEPTTALDVTTQAQVLAVLRRICSDQQMALLLISHDLAVVACTVERVLVMLAGEIVEEAPVDALFNSPSHPYTRMLLDAARGSATTAEEGVPRVSAATLEQRRAAGCRFSARCPLVQPYCREQHPQLRDLVAGRRTRCLLEE